MKMNSNSIMCKELQKNMESCTHYLLANSDSHPKMILNMLTTKLKYRYYMSIISKLCRYTRTPTYK